MSRTAGAVVLSIGLLSVFTPHPHVSALVTFGTLPEGCSLKSSERDNTDDTIDCEGRNYAEIPFFSIPCDIKRINFANNNFTRITRDSFRGLQQLEDIDLASNRISYIEAEAFGGLPNLQTVNLVNNRINDMDERPFWKGQYSSLMVQVDGNPWYCDERLKETVQSLYGKVSFIGLICRGGFIEGVRGTIVGREFEDVRLRIENDFEGWEIALITVGCVGFVVLCAVAAYFGLLVYQGRFASEKGYETQLRRPDSPTSDRRLSDESREMEDATNWGADMTNGVPPDADPRGVNDPYYPEDAAFAQPPSVTGSARIESPPPPRPPPAADFPPEIHV